MGTHVRFKAGPSGMEPAGMLRIRQDSQERFVWPVHLPGWLALGWQVERPEPIHTPAATECSAAEEVSPSSSGGRRGRRRKEHSDPAEPPLPEAAPEPEQVLAALPVDLLDEPLS